MSSSTCDWIDCIPFSLRLQRHVPALQKACDSSP
jgi:hypothetical protein